MRTLHLDILKEGLPGITVAAGNFMHEALLVALVKNNHHSGVILKVEGVIEEEIALVWKESPNKNIIKAWVNDANIAHHASLGLTLLLMFKLAGFQSFEVASYGTGVDYWMNKKIDDSKVFHKEARLEVSGIFKETSSNTIQMRLNLKKKQVRKSDNSNTSAWIAVVAFNIPKSKIEKQ